MATIRDEINKMGAYGTSEGASKAWDTRGRGKVSDEHYKMNHGKSPIAHSRSQGGGPSGHGSWMFSPVRNPDMARDKEHVFTHNGPYHEAKQKASEWAKEKGHDLIHVLP